MSRLQMNDLEKALLRSHLAFNSNMRDHLLRVAESSSFLNDAANFINALMPNSSGLPFLFFRFGKWFRKSSTFFWVSFPLYSCDQG